MEVLTSPPKGLEVSLRHKRIVVYNMREIGKKYRQKLVTNCCCYDKWQGLDLAFELKVLEILNVKNPNTCEEEIKHYNIFCYVIFNFTM